MTKGIEKKNASFLAVPMPCVKTANHAHICLLCFCLHGPVCFAGRKETKGRETAPTPETWEPDERFAATVWLKHQGAAAAAGGAQRAHIHTLFMFIVYVLNYISMELQSIEQNTHNHVIHPSILPSIFLTTHLPLGYRKLIPAVIGWKTGYFLCRLQYNHIKNIYSLKNNHLWHSNSTGFSSFSTYLF